MNNPARVMNVREAIMVRRTIRRFRFASVSRPVLKELVDGARLAPSAANLQPLKYLVVDHPPLLSRVFKTLRWASALGPGGAPPPGRRPPAYVIILVDKEIREVNYQWESGAAAENILLAAWEKGIGSCWLLSVDRPRLAEALGIPTRYLIDSVIALGYPAERPRVVAAKKGTRYYKDGNGVLRIPKRRLKEILFFNRIIL